MRFFASLPLVDLPLYNKVALIVINLVAVGLILTVFYRSSFKNVRSRIFVSMGILMLLWVDFAYLARLAGKEAVFLSEVFLRIAWVATPLLFYFTYLTSIYVIRKEKYYRFLNRALLVLAILLSGATAFTDLIIAGVTFVDKNLDIVYGAGFYPFLAIIFSFMLFTLVPLFRTRLTKRAQSFLFGVLIFYLANLIFNIFLPVFLGITHLYYIGDYSTIFLLGLTAWAIVKHELFDVKIVATEALTVIIWIILLSRLFVSQSAPEALVDALVLGVMVVFGVLLIRSVVREIRHRERLQHLSQKLKALDRQKDEFISMAAHELRAPTTAVKGYLSMLLEGDAGQIPEKAIDFLTDAEAINDRVIRLVNNMLNVSRIEQGRMVYQMGIVRLSDVVQAVFDSFKLEAKRKGLDFSVDIQPDLEDHIYVDKDRIHEVIANLVSNAIKYTTSGSVSINLLVPKADWIRLEVSDTGPGISEEEQEKLFRKFYRVKSTVGKTMGTGLGLYISKLLIDKFWGKMGVTSKVGKGSTFWFELPVEYRKAKGIEPTLLK